MDRHPEPRAEARQNRDPITCAPVGLFAQGATRRAAPDIERTPRSAPPASPGDSTHSRGPIDGARARTGGGLSRPESPPLPAAVSRAASFLICGLRVVLRRLSESIRPLDRPGEPLESAPESL